MLKRSLLAKFRKANYPRVSVRDCLGNHLFYKFNKLRLEDVVPDSIMVRLPQDVVIDKQHMIHISLFL